MVSWIKQVAAVITALTIVGSCALFAVNSWLIMMFLVESISARNIAVLEDKRCKGKLVTEDQHKNLMKSYELYELSVGTPHLYTGLTKPEICAHRAQE